jgi:Asp/Glu/hydantoin racemase
LSRLLLINPNSSRTTTAMMVAIARGCLADDIDVVGAFGDPGLEALQQSVPIPVVGI